MASLLDILGSLFHNQSLDDYKYNNQPTPTAQARFTQTPIGMGSQANGPSDMGQSVPHQDPVTGQYNSGGQITTYSAPNATYNDLQTVLAHEQIHALLNSMQSDKGPTYNVPGGDTAIDAFRSSHRSGSPSIELPAYLGVYKPGQIKGVSAQDANTYMQQMIQSLPPSIGAILQRIIQSQQKVQK